MTFRFTIKQNPLSIEFDSATLDEGLAILSSNSNRIGQAFAEFRESSENDDDEPGAGVNGGDNPLTLDTLPDYWTKLKAPELKDLAATLNGGERPKDKASAVKVIEDALAARATEPVPPPAAPETPPPAPPVATAPAPIQPPGETTGAPPVAPTPPSTTAADDGEGIPAFLDRTGRAAAAAPPPVAPVAAPPVPPSTERLADKVIAAVRKAAEAGGEAGEAGEATYAEWLHKSGLVVEGASLKEAFAVIQFLADDHAQLKAVAAALGVA